MERPTFEAMLVAAEGVDPAGDGYTVSEGYSVSIYIGEPGQAMEVSEIAALKLGETFFAAKSREHSATYFVEYSSLHGLCVRPPTGGGGRRAGFG